MISRCPFKAGTDEHAIWTMLVERDIAAFVACDWNAVAGDFDEAQFMGINAHKSPDVDQWRLQFPSLKNYREEWLRQAEETRGTIFVEDLLSSIHRATRLEEIEIKGSRALAHKKFDGRIRKADGTDDILNWRTLYHCEKQNSRWLITGFTGYMFYK